MPTGKSQKSVACMVLAMREGKLDKKRFPKVAGMMKEMSTSDLEKFCKGEVKKEE